MLKEELIQQLNKEISSYRAVDKTWFLNLLDDQKQKAYEDRHIRALLLMLRELYICKEQTVVKECEEKIDFLRRNNRYSAEDYQKINAYTNEIAEAKARIEGYRHFFDEPYFARMDVQDDKEGYHAYYIGKKGDFDLGIVDWRAPLSHRYYQKSQRNFTINEYDYTVVLRRAIRTKAGKVIDFKNEHLSVRDYLTKEEIGGKDEEIVLDPFLREIIKARKDDASVKDIIETIQEKQFDFITRPEDESFVLQGCAGSGKTMVLLHRLSHLLYNDEELSPRDILVITPSRSFNSFIDELSQVLELEKVRTITLQDYFLQVLEASGVAIGDRLHGGKEDISYLAYLYSNDYAIDLTAAIERVYQDVYGLFASEECKGFADVVLNDCRAQNEAYTRIKNASTRVRRAVLGEIKEDENGNPRYTKPFRDFMRDVIEIEEFLTYGVEDGNKKSQIEFYRQLSRFYRSASRLAKGYERVIDEALLSLHTLTSVVEREMTDLKRYKIKTGGQEVLTYADRIRAREELLKEKESIEDAVREIGERSSAFSEFFEVLQGDKTLSKLGKCQDALDIARWFYTLTVKKIKLKYGMSERGLYPSDVYALLVVLSTLGQTLTPHYKLVFVDEGQDVSPAEYALLKKINQNAAFNVYGDLMQNVTPWRGVTNWQTAVGDIPVYSLNQNYRNTNQIVAFVGKIVDVDMSPIGFDGASVTTIKPKEIGKFLIDKKGVRAVICSEQNLLAYRRSHYNVVQDKGALSKKKINLLTVYESKGLEFSAVAVVDEGMSDNERYIAYTRALDWLAVVRDA